MKSFDFVTPPNKYIDEKHDSAKPSVGLKLHQSISRRRRSRNSGGGAGGIPFFGRSKMARTKCKKQDLRTPLEKLQQSTCGSKVDLLIFFRYYDGYSTKGTVGYDVNQGKPGSTTHFNGIVALVYTKNQFRAKAKRLVQIVQSFIDRNEVPPEAMRPVFSREEVDEIKRRAEEPADLATPLEKFEKKVKTELDAFVFFKYYDGFITDGYEGFHMRSGAPGSIHHKRAWVRQLASMSDDEFRRRGKELGELASELIQKGVDPPTDRRPIMEEFSTRTVPQGMRAEASRLGFVVDEENDGGTYR